MEGSKTISTVIKLADVVIGVQANSYYAGEARKDNTELLEAGARIQASDDEDELLKDYIKTGVTKLTNVLTKILGETTCVWGTDDVTFTTKTVANFMDSQKDSLLLAMKDYLVDTCLRDWLALMKPGEEKLFENKLTELSAEIRVLASHRKKPVRS